MDTWTSFAFLGDKSMALHVEYEIGNLRELFGINEIFWERLERGEIEKRDLLLIERCGKIRRHCTLAAAIKHMCRHISWLAARGDN